MEFIYLVKNDAQLHHYQMLSESISTKLTEFIFFLEKSFAVSDLPKATVFTSEEIATHLISSIPLPGYTNEFRTIFCPDPDVWKRIYLGQTNDARIHDYYKERLSMNHVTQILGHEFVHHSNLFLDEAYESARWFEEGMCEYISRKYFLTEEEFQEAEIINRLLVQFYEEKHGTCPLEAFSADTYSKNLSCIFYFYWKSFLAVNSLVTHFNGDIIALFRSYHDWYAKSPEVPLSNWFQI